MRRRVRPTSFTVAAHDPYGNIATGYLGTVEFTSSDSGAVLPVTYTFTAADQGSHTFSAVFETAGTQSLTATDVASPGIPEVRKISKSRAQPPVRS